MTQPAPRTLRCANCRAPIEYDASASALKCHYCGSTQTIEVQGPAIERGLRDASQVVRGYGRSMKGQRCTDCGARVAFEPTALAGRCPFCASARVADGDVEGIRPENVLPFSVTSQQAADLFKKWIRGLWFRPNDLKHLAELQEVRGVYLPFWSFDTEARSWWSADAGYYVNERSSDGKSTTRRTRWEPVSGTRVDEHHDELVCASQGLPKALLPRLYPFRMEQLVAYTPEFLAGWGAEAASIDADDAWRAAKEALDQKQRALCASIVPGDTHRKLHVSTEYSRIRVKSALLPVFVSAYVYRGRPYRLLINGQTGKVSGQAPLSVAKVLIAILVGLLIAGGIALGVHQSQQPAPRPSPASTAPATRPTPAKEAAPARPAPSKEVAPTKPKPGKTTTPTTPTQRRKQRPPPQPAPAPTE